MTAGEDKARMGSMLATGPVVTCMKSLMMVFNFIFWVTGVVILAIGIWTKVDMYQYLELSSIYQPEAPYILIGVGALIVTVGGIGCCITVKGHSVLLYGFSAFLLIVFCVELSAGITLMVYRGKLEKGFKEGLTEALDRYGKEDSQDITHALDDLQKKLKCCGIHNYTDWYQTPYAKQQGGKNVPESCCRVARNKCVHEGLSTNIAKQYIHIQGCHKLVVDFIDGNMGPIGGVALGISFFQVLGAVLAYCLAKSISKSKYEQVL